MMLGRGGRSAAGWMALHSAAARTVIKVGAVIMVLSLCRSGPRPRRFGATGSTALPGLAECSHAEDVARAIVRRALRNSGEGLHPAWFATPESTAAATMTPRMASDLFLIPTLRAIFQAVSQHGFSIRTEILPVFRPEASGEAAIRSSRANV